MMNDFEFSEEEIIQELKKLGYSNVPKEKLAVFKHDLKSLMTDDKSQRSWFTSSSGNDSSENNDKANFRGQCDPMSKNKWLFNEVNSSGVNAGITDNHGKLENKMIYSSRENVPAYQNFKSIYNPTLGKENMQVFPNTKSEPIIINAPSFSRAKENDSPNSSCLNSSNSSDSRYIKRRILRKIDGHVKIDDELVESEYGDYSALEEKLRLLHVNNNDDSSYLKWDPEKQLQYYMSGKREPNHRPHSACSVRSDDSRFSEDYDIHKAFIRPMTSDPHNRNLKKHDPVSAYHKYKTSWMTNKAPGEKNHKNLRWAVREQMLQHDEIIEKRPIQSNAPNKYVIPSDKKRNNLRWQIRHELAQGIKPFSVYDE